MTVNALPVYSTTAPTSVCVGDAITLSATPAGGVWSIFSGSSSSSLSGSTLTGSGAGTTVVRYTDGNGCVVDQSITVNGLPPVSAGSRPVDLFWRECYVDGKWSFFIELGQRHRCYESCDG